MPIFSTAIAAASLAVQVVSTVASLGEQQRAGEARGKQQAKQRRLAEVRNIREKRRAIAQSRVARAQATARTEAAGATGSVQEGLEAAATGAGAAQVGFLAQSGALVEEANIFAGQVAEHTQRAGAFQAIAGIGSSIFQGAGGFETIFQEKPTEFKTHTPVKFQPTGGASFGGRR